MLMVMCNQILPESHKAPSSSQCSCHGPHPTASALRPSKGCHQTHLRPHGDEGVEVEQRAWSKLGAQRLANPIPKFKKCSRDSHGAGPEENHKEHKGVVENIYLKSIYINTPCEIMFNKDMSKPEHSPTPLISRCVKMFEATCTLPWRDA